MTDRLIKVLEQGRILTRGINKDGSRAFMVKDHDETLPITVDWSAWLGTDTISSVTNEAHGPGVSSASNTTTKASLTISGNSGHVEHRITTAAGAIKELTIIVNAEEARKTYPRFI